jgi:hypothetical protein
MAKRQQEEIKQLPAAPAAAVKIEEFAEDLGKLLGQARGKAENWLDQRNTIVKNLTELRDTATKLLADLGHQAEKQVAKVTGKRLGRPPGARKAPPTPIETAKRVLSPEARQRISDAQKARWASVKAKTRR